MGDKKLPSCETGHAGAATVLRGLARQRYKNGLTPCEQQQANTVVYTVMGGRARRS